MRIRIPALLLMLFLTGLPVYADGETSSSYEISWDTGDLIIKTSVKISDLSRVLPTARRKGEQIIEQNFPSLLRQALFSFRVNSWQTARDIALEKSEVLSGIQELRLKGEIIESILSPDMTTLTLCHRFNLFPHIIDLFIEHTIPYRNPPMLTWAPSAEFSGLVIYAADELPIQGEPNSDEEFLKPTMFPRIYDENMRLIAEVKMVEPEFLKQWGIVGYSKDTNEAPFLERIGITPLRTSAVRLFGTNRTDIIIPLEIANKLLQNDHNLDLISQGRILIISPEISDSW
ncbi:MAG: hypothetical protein KAU17_03630 [Spirochaetales bacterium]|nr:hypothetical protein [Spirochaetales bacterium]